MLIRKLARASSMLVCSYESLLASLPEHARSRGRVVLVVEHTFKQVSVSSKCECKVTKLEEPRTCRDVL